LLSIEDFLRFISFAIFFAGDFLPLRRAYHSQRPASARQIVEFGLRARRLGARCYLIRRSGLPVSAAMRALGDRGVLTRLPTADRSRKCDPQKTIELVSNPGPSREIHGTEEWLVYNKNNQSRIVTAGELRSGVGLRAAQSNRPADQ
jgi:hypothetical protein